MYSQPFGVKPDGTVAKTIVDRYSDEGTRYLETLIVKATVKDARVTGTIEGTSKRTKPNGRVVRCTCGRLDWSAGN